MQCTSITSRHLTVFWLVTTVRAKIADNPFLHEYSAQVSQIVSITELTVLWLITTLWAEMS